MSKEIMNWISVSEQLPKTGAPVLACYKNSHGKFSRVRAKFIPAKTEEAGSDDEFFEYDEETDAYYLPEGWYECINNWDDYTAVAIYEGKVEYWMELPPAPNESEKGEKA